MPTINQLTRHLRKKKIKKMDRVLGDAPQRKGVLTKVYLTGPKKPNSANRTCAKVTLSSGGIMKKLKREVIIYIPYQDGRKDAKVHGVVYIAKRNKVDMPGIRHVAIRGWGDLPGVLTARKGRSRKGAKKPEKTQ